MSSRLQPADYQFLLNKLTGKPTKLPPLKEAQTHDRVVKKLKDKLK